MSSGPTVDPASPYPPNSSPSLYNKGSQPGMFWAQETIPQMYLHKLSMSSIETRDTEFDALVKDFWEDITKNVRGDTISNTPAWPLFALVIDRQTSLVGASDVTNKDILKFKGMTGQFVTWNALHKYLMATDDAKRLRHGLQTEFKWTEVDTDEHRYSKVMSDAIILRINFVGILKNIPTGGVGSTSVSMNVIAGGRVTMVNHWGVNCLEGTRLYFLIVIGPSEKEGSSPDDKRMKIIPYANPYSNEQPSPGIPLDLEVRNDVDKDLQNYVLRAISVGRCLHATANIRMNNRVHEIRKDPRGRTYMRYTTQISQNINLRNLGKIEVYVGI
ncbi:hypothetical protein CYMTET_41022 [Cymbomonas tetramitiformis]|uniref:Uncharacterized protein n=1 Tax=Cymbomonas tetramitiformis TaxID=36881 RepID=A0AAE0F2D8_9CHLO|nr:hypothetical protein CYMTET_41029 [Cymbomonas tetramitiformis]KAK3249576.1 hypothetical protein CYMTET_41022 [Cymbomonas tetramitiformis]